MTALNHRASAAPVALSLVTLCGPAAHAGVTWFEEDFSGWQSAAGAYTPLTFTEFAHNTFITDQYADKGVLFTDSDPNVVWNIDEFLLDQHGINGLETVELTFAQPTLALGAYGPGYWQVILYSGTTEVYWNDHLSLGDTGFAGLVSTVAFDRAVFFGAPPSPIPDFIYFDNFYFTSVPGPGGACVLLTSFCVRGDRRRRHEYRPATEEPSRAYRTSRQGQA